MGSQVGQDQWVLSLFPEGYKGTFLDVGCYLPIEINNTYLLEQNGWIGISIDNRDYSKEWEIRNTQFVCEDIFKIDFTDYLFPKVIDYLSMDIDGCGYNYRALWRLIDTGFNFRAITIEHNLYLGEGFNEAERLPQRELLINNNYKLVREDVEDGGNKFEDWWIGYKAISLNL